MERTSLQCRLSTTQSRPKSSIWYSKKMFYTEGWKAESPKPGNSNHLLVDSHPEMYYQPPQPVEYHTRTQQPQPANGPYQPVHESELSRTVNPAQVYTSRAPMHFNNDISMSSIQPLMSEKEAQGTLESPFTSKVLRREYDNGGSRSGFSALPSSSPRHPPPAMVEVENEPPTVPEESVKPVLPPLPKRVDQPPRPQNAWILYRSDRLRAIAAGEHIPGLLAVLEEHSLVRAPELNEQKPPNGKESPSSAEGGRFQLFKDAEPSPPVTTSDQLEDNAEESRNKYRRALLQADISKVISMMWRRECQDVKSKYESMAEAKKLEHQQKYPNYKYQPVRKEDKIKHQEQIKAEKERVKKEAMAAKAHQHKLAKVTRQVKEGRERSLPYTHSSVSEKRGRRPRRVVSRASHVLTIPLSPKRYTEQNRSGNPSGQAFSSAELTTSVKFEEPLSDSAPESLSVKQEPREQPYVSPLPDQQDYLKNTEEYPGSMNFTYPTYYPMEGHQIYNLHPEGYAVPVSQPGFVVQQNQVIPYTFETIPMEMTYFSRTSERASREQLAIAVMEHSGYQPIGVSETELAEMWSLLEDDGGPSAIQSDTQTYTTNTTHMANLSDGDARIEKWDNLPVVADETGPTTILLDQLSGAVASRIAMNWVDEQGQTSPSPDATPVLTNTAQMGGQSFPVESRPLAMPAYHRRPSAPFATYQAFQTRENHARYSTRDAPLSVQTPLSPIDGMFTPIHGTYPSVFAQSPYRQTCFSRGPHGIDDNQMNPYYQQMFPSDFIGQPGAGAYEYRLLASRTANFQDSQFPPLSMSAPS